MVLTTKKETMQMLKKKEILIKLTQVMKVTKIEKQKQSMISLCVKTHKTSLKES